MLVLVRFSIISPSFYGISEPGDDFGTKTDAGKRRSRGSEAEKLSQFKVAIAVAEQGDMMEHRELKRWTACNV